VITTSAIDFCGIENRRGFCHYEEQNPEDGLTIEVHACLWVTGALLTAPALPRIRGWFRVNAGRRCRLQAGVAAPPAMLRS
jgi:hypothetical protein